MMDRYIFGITGGSGAGKSTVSDMFRKKGVFVSDADKAAREVVKVGKPCLNELVEEFGREILNNDGTLNRKCLAGIVFSDKEKLDILNNITHKYIYEHIVNEINNSSCEICAIDGAVIIGSPVMELCRVLVAVTASREVRINRIVKRDGISRILAENRINAQFNDDYYKTYSEYEIVNNGDMIRLGEQIEQIYNKIKIKSKEESANKETQS